MFIALSLTKSKKHKENYSLLLCQHWVFNLKQKPLIDAIIVQTIFCKPLKHNAQ
jgi:hypothetical protein